MSDTETRNHHGEGTPGRLLGEFEAPSLEAWHEEVLRLLKGAPYEKRMLTETYEGITLRPMYSNDDVKDLGYLAAPPGDAPYARGTSRLGYRGAPWLVAQELPYADYHEFNQALRESLERGQSAVNLLLDTASQAGKDPDHAQPGQVGDEGTSIASVVGVSRALAGVDLEFTPLLVQPGSAALPFAAMVVAWLRTNGREVSRLQGSLGMDPIAGLVAHGELPLGLPRAYDELAVLCRWAADHAPGVRTLSAYGFPYHEGGGNAVQELAFTLAAAVQGLRELERRGIGVAESAARLQFGFSVGTQFFMEIAKLRAARVLWARAVEASGGGAAGRMVIHARTSHRELTRIDPHVNILRATTAAFAAVMGGCDSLHVAPFDAAFGVPSELGRRLARNTQTILREECHFDAVIDPAGGSWYVEVLTDQLAKDAWTLFQRVEACGGIVAALQDGWPQREVAEVASHRQRNAAVRKDVLVGTTVYPNAAEVQLTSRTADLRSFHATRSLTLQHLRTSLEHGQALEVLERLNTIFECPAGELFENLVRAAEAGATIGELTAILRHGEGDHPRVQPINPFRTAQPFEALRRRVEAWRTGIPGPQVFLANIGPVAGYMPRLDFSRSFFQVGGFSVEGDRWFADPEEAASAAVSAGTPIVAIVSTDERYPDAVPAIAAKVKAARPNAVVVVAGLPKDQVERMRQAGVDEFIHVRADVPAVLGDLAHRIGVTV